MSQNLISLAFTDEQLAAVDAALAALESNFDGLISLQPAQRRGLNKMGDKSDKTGSGSLTAASLGARRSVGWPDTGEAAGLRFDHRSKVVPA